MLPADFPFLSFSRTSVKDVHLVFFGKKKAAASSAINQSCLNRMGHVIANSVLSKTEHTPSGAFALSFVQEGTLLL